MKKIHSLDELRAQILYLENKRTHEEDDLKKAFHDTMESMRLTAILKKTAKDLAASPEFKNDLVNAGMSLSAGYLSKRLTFGRKGGIMKWLFGSLLQMGVTNVVAKNADAIKSGGLNFIQSFFRKSVHEKEDEQENEPVEQREN
jgi:hypothetical protein